MLLQKSMGGHAPFSTLVVVFVLRLASENMEGATKKGSELNYSVNNVSLL